jgi:hypothetical protein
MPADPIHPDQLDGEQRFRADLAAYLDSLPIGELAGLLGQLPVMTRVTLMHELSDRGPAWARLPATWPQHPDAEHLGRRSLRRSSRTGVPLAPPAAPPPPPFGRAAGDRWVAESLARRRSAGAVAERGLARCYAAQPRPGLSC